MNNTFTIPVTFEDIRERKPIMFDIGDKVSLKGLTFSGVIIGTNIYGWYGVQSEDGYVCYISPENLIKAEDKGMSKFKVGDVVKFNNNGLFYKIVHLSKECVVTSKLNDTDNKITSKQEISFDVNSLLYFGMELATDVWIAYQEKQKAKEESKTVVAILKDLVSKIESGDIHVFTGTFDYSKTRIIGGNVVSLKFEGISK